MIDKIKRPENKKENIYLLFEKGIDLAPMIMELVVWSDKYIRAFHSDMNDLESGNKNLLVKRIQKEYRKFVRQTMS